MSVRTLRAWEGGARRMPAATWAWLKTLTSGFPLQGPEWAGWLFKGGKFISPENVEIGTGQINALPYTYGRLAELEKAIKREKETNVLPFARPVEPDRLRRRHEYRGRLTMIVRSIATLEGDLLDEFDDPELQALAPGVHQLLETACGHYLPLMKLTRELAR